jgi:hypothetical protein
MNRYLVRIILALALIAGGIYVVQQCYFFNHEPQQRVLDELRGPAYHLQEGDIIFQTSRSSQSEAIQLATHSPYSHCGIILKKGDSLMVFEAIEPVQFTPLKTWIARGKNGEHIVKRLKNTGNQLTDSSLQIMKTLAASWTGKHYDSYFEWTDDKLYCSELVWKLYQRSTGIALSEPQRLKDFDLSSAAVQQKMKERYGEAVPLEELVVSPAALYDSPLLITVDDE